MKQKKFQNVIFLILWFLELAALAFLVATVWRIDILPNQYLMVLVAASMLFWSLTGLLLFLPSKKPGGGKIRKGLATLLILVLVVACAVLVTIATDLYNALHQIQDQPNDRTVIRNVYVRADDPAQTLKDTKDYTYAIVEGHDEAYIQAALNNVNATLGTKVTVKTYDSMAHLVDALYDRSVDAILLSGSYATILEDDGGYTDFSQRTRILYQVELEEINHQNTKPTGGNDPTKPTNPDDPTEPSEVTLPSIENPKDITNTPFIIYVSGSDSRSSTIRDSRSDVNILVVVNPETKQVLLINTPRDFYIPNPAGNGALDKLTHCGNFGIENSMQALSDLYNVPISYYAQINFAGFEAFIDAIGGVTVYSEYSFTAIDTRISKGENHLSGREALNFARERHNVEGGDNERGRHQMMVIQAVIQKVTGSTALISGYADILNSLSGMFRTNISVEEMSQLVKMQLSDMASWTINSYAAKGSDTGGYVYTYSAPGVQLWAMNPKYHTVYHATSLIEKIVSGQSLTEEDLQDPPAP